mgnify:CR=1 FL=1
MRNPSRNRLGWPTRAGLLALVVASWAMLRLEEPMQARLFGSGILAVEFAGSPDRWADIVATNGALGMAAVRESLRWDPAYIVLYAVVLTLLMRRLTRIDQAVPHRAQWLPTIAAGLDLVEDGCLWASLDYPSALPLAIAAAGATIKFALLGTVLGYALRSWRRTRDRGHRLV